MLFFFRGHNGFIVRALVGAVLLAVGLALHHGALLVGIGLVLLVWGGIGAAITAATLGPFVSMLKGWYMSFWPALALLLIVVAAVVGSVLTAICRPYWG